jgi:hypothetical protein
MFTIRRKSQYKEAPIQPRDLEFLMLKATGREPIHLPINQSGGKKGRTGGVFFFVLRFLSTFSGISFLSTNQLRLQDENWKSLRIKGKQKKGAITESIQDPIARSQAGDGVTVNVDASTQCLDFILFYFSNFGANMIAEEKRIPVMLMMAKVSFVFFYFDKEVRV